MTPSIPTQSKSGPIRLTPQNVSENKNITIGGSVGPGAAIGLGARVVAENIAGGDIHITNIFQNLPEDEKDERPRFYIHDFTNTAPEKVNVLKGILENINTVPVINKGFDCKPSNRPEFVIDCVGYCHSAILLVDKAFVEKAPYEMTVLWWILRLNNFFRLLFIYVDDCAEAGNYLNTVNGKLCVSHENKESTFLQYLSLNHHSNQIKVLQSFDLECIEHWVKELIKPANDLLIKSDKRCIDTHFEWVEEYIVDSLGNDINFDLLISKFEQKKIIGKDFQHYRNQGIKFKVIRDSFRDRIDQLRVKKTIIENISRENAQKFVEKCHIASLTNEIDIAAINHFYDKFENLNESSLLIGINDNDRLILDLYFLLAYEPHSNYNPNEMIDKRPDSNGNQGSYDLGVKDIAKVKVIEAIYEENSEFELSVHRLLIEEFLKMAQITNKSLNLREKKKRRKRRGVKVLAPLPGSAQESELRDHLRSLVQSKKLNVIVSTILDEPEDGVALKIPDELVACIRQIQSVYDFLPFIVLNPNELHTDTKDIEYLKPILKETVLNKIYDEI